MANLVITNACNLACPFCFASEYLADGDARPALRMSLDEFQAQLRFIGDGDIRFCGGEPTTHPDFLAMLALALETPARRVFVMTNGVWPPGVRRAVGALRTADRVRARFLVNVLEPSFYTAAQRALLDDTLRELHPLAVTLGLTLHRADMPYAHVLDLARRFRIERVRFSVASPNTTDPSTWLLEPRRDFPALAATVHRLVVDARARGLTVHSDCGYIPPCFFSERQRADLAGVVEYRCGGPVDIGPGGEAWRCYGLYSVVRARTAEFEDVPALAEDFERRTAQLHDRPMFDECAACDWRARGECMGGCFAYRVARDVRQRAGLVRIGEDARLMDAVPRTVDGRLHAIRRGASTEWMVKEHGTWVPLDAGEVELRVLQACDGTRSVRDIVDELQRDRVLREPAPTVTRTIRRLFEREAISLG